MVITLIARSTLLRRLNARKCIYLAHSAPKLPNFPKVFIIATAPYSLFNNYSGDNMENFDLKLKEACESGEHAIQEFMNFLQKNVTDLSGAYKECLQKQINLVDEATKAGAQSPKWDDLPQYRTMAADLKKEFQSVVATINILGQIAQNDALKYITQQEEHFKLLTLKYKELEKIIANHLQEINKLELNLLAKDRDSIEKTR